MRISGVAFSGVGFDPARPRNWGNLSEDEQFEWIYSYFMPKRKIPEPILKKNEMIRSGKFETERGIKLEIKDKPVMISRKNQNLEREFEEWNGKWLITVFHDKSLPHKKFVSIGNPKKRQMDCSRTFF